MEGMKIPGREVYFRSAGGHIHFGIGKTTDARAKRIVKTLDAILGVACVSLFAKYDEPRRRSMYGLAGEYRLPPHGLEYRTLSNAWMVHPVITHLVFDLSRKVLVFGDKDYLRHWDGNEKETVEVINTCNVEGARAILKRNEKLFKDILSAAYPNFTSPQVHILYTIFLEGMETAVNPEEMEQSWRIGVVGVGAWVRHSDGANQCVKMAIEGLMKKAQDKKKEEAA
jgi:hypothetical protein